VAEYLNTCSRIEESLGVAGLLLAKSLISLREARSGLKMGLVAR
jgi:hypothetical protein